jgi:hypothetical protein
VFEAEFQKEKGAIAMGFHVKVMEGERISDDIHLGDREQQREQREQGTRLSVVGLVLCWDYSSG